MIDISKNIEVPKPKVAALPNRWWHGIAHLQNSNILQMLYKLFFLPLKFFFNNLCLLSLSPYVSLRFLLKNHYVYSLFFIIVPFPHLTF